MKLRSGWVGFQVWVNCPKFSCIFGGCFPNCKREKAKVASCDEEQSEVGDPRDPSRPSGGCRPINRPPLQLTPLLPFNTITYSRIIKPSSDVWHGFEKKSFSPNKISFSCSIQLTNGNNENCSKLVIRKSMIFRIQLT